MKLEASKSICYELPLSHIFPDPEQPRKYFDAESLKELAESIKEHGLLQPILVRPTGELGKYIIVNGERRFRAHHLARLLFIKCFIRDLDLKSVRDLQLLENLERNNLSEIELAYEFQRRVKEGQTHEQIANAIKKTRSFVTQRLALLALSKELQDQLLTGKLSFSNARQLLGIKDESLRKNVSEQLGENSTVAQVASLIKKDENVTRVTYDENNNILPVKKLAVYQLILNRETVTVEELKDAIGRDLQFLRGPTD